MAIVSLQVSVIKKGHDGKVQRRHTHTVAVEFIEKTKQCVARVVFSFRRCHSECAKNLNAVNLKHDVREDCIDAGVA